MKRVSSLTLSLLVPFVAFACSSEPDTSGTNNPPNNTAGTPAATGGTPAATGGTPAATGGTPATTGGAATGGAATAGATTGGASTGGAGASAGGTGGASGGTAGAATGGGGAATGGGGAGGTGGGACPAKIDSATACTSVVTCPAAVCGVFKLGAKNCECAAASGNFTCTSCDYTGKTESIVQKPASALTACTMDDATLEATTGCTSGDRCKSTTVGKERFCACWTDPTKGGTVWDCDAIPKSWTQ